MSHNLLILEKFLAHSLLTFSIASVFLQDEASSYRNMLLALVKGNWSSGLQICSDACACATSYDTVLRCVFFFSVNLCNEHWHILHTVPVFFRLCLILASCLIYAQPFRHTALSQTTTPWFVPLPWPDRWLVAVYAHFIDSLCPFCCSFECVLLSNNIYLTTMYHSTIPHRFIWSICPGN